MDRNGISPQWLEVFEEMQLILVECVISGPPYIIVEPLRQRIRVALNRARAMTEPLDELECIGPQKAKEIEHGEG